nr:MAG TPA: hypothetical protein [Caudoviricetes sp.]
MKSMVSLIRLTIGKGTLRQLKDTYRLHMQSAYLVTNS